MSTRPREVLMLGPGLQEPGGIAAVERLLVEHWPGTGPWRLEHLSTTAGVTAPRWRKAAAGLLAAWRLFSRLAGGGADLVHVHLAQRGSFPRKLGLLLLARLFGRRVLLHAHGSEFRVWYENECGPLTRRLVRWGLARADRLLVLSEDWRLYYAKLAPRTRPLVLPNAAPPPPGEIPDRRGHEFPVILTLGRLGRRKGTWDLLAALPAILQRHPRAELWLGGDGETEAVARMAAAEPWGSQVKVLGWVAGNRKEEVLARADVFVLPSYNEGLPVAILEAMARALPVVATPVGGIPEAVADGRTGRLIPPGDPEALAAAVNGLLADPGLRRRLGAAGRQLAADRFAVAAVIRQLSAIYDGLN